MIISNEETVGELAAAIPGTAHVFEKYGIDCCCGGKHALNWVGRERGSTQEILPNELAEAAAPRVASDDRDWNALPLRELIGHILSRHHVYLRSELPRIAVLFAKVVSAHGGRQPVLYQVREIFDVLWDELDAHMKQEELIFFPIIEKLEAHGAFMFVLHARYGVFDGAETHCLMQMRRLTLDYTLPDEACNTYRALFAALTELETDLHQHIHLENNVLFPRAAKLQTR